MPSVYEQRTEFRKRLRALLVGFMKEGLDPTTVTTMVSAEVGYWEIMEEARAGLARGWRIFIRAPLGGEATDLREPMAIANAHEAERELRYLDPDTGTPRRWP